VLVPLVTVLLGLAAACGSGQSPAQPAPASTGNTAAATQAAATTVQPAAAAPTVVPTTAAAQPGAASAQAPAKVASAIAVASAGAQRGGSQAAAKTIDPCLLVTRATAEAAAKTSLAALRQYSDAAGPACEYSSDSSEVSVTVTALASGGRSAYDDTGSVYGQSRTDVTGVGDKAFLVIGQGVMYVLKGDTLVTLQLVSLKMSRDETSAALTALAQTALSHL